MNNLEREPAVLGEEMIEIDLREYFDIIWKRRKIIISLLLIAMISSYIISGFMTRIYETSTLVMVKEDSGMESLFSEQMMPFGSQENKVATYTQILKSRTLVNQVIKELNLRNKETGELIEPKSLRQRITVSGGSDSELITINVIYSDPERAKNIANTLVAKFKEMNQRMNRSDLSGAAKFISEQLVTVKNKLSKLENQLLKYKEEHGVVLPKAQGEATLEQLTKLETAKAKAEVAYNQAQASLKEVKTNLNQQDRSIIATKMITKNPLIQEYQKQLFALEIELTGLLESYTTKNPQVVAVKKKIDEVRQRLEKAVEEVISSKTKSMNPIYQSLKENIITLQTKMIASQVQIQTYQEQIKKMKKELDSLPEKELALARLQRESKVAENIYTMLMEKKEEIQIQEAMKTSDIAVIDPAIVNEEPIKPKTKLNVVIASFLAIFISIGIIFVMEYLDTTVKEEEDIERLTGLPVLGVIPKFKEAEGNKVYGRGGSDE